MSRNGSSSPFPTMDTVLPARNRRVVPGSRVTWLSGSALREIGSRSDQADRCAAGAAHDRERHEQERRDRSPPNRRNRKPLGHCRRRYEPPMVTVLNDPAADRASHPAPTPIPSPWQDLPPPLAPPH